MDAKRLPAQRNRVISLPRVRPRKPSPAWNPTVMASCVIVQVLRRLAGAARGREPVRRLATLRPTRVSLVSGAETARSTAAFRSTVRGLETRSRAGEPYEGQGVVDALADRVDEICGHLPWIERGDQPRGCGLPWRDACYRQYPELADVAFDAADPIDVLCATHRGASIDVMAERWPPRRASSSVMEIVACVGFGEPSNALLQFRGFGAALLSRNVPFHARDRPRRWRRQPPGRLGAATC